MNRRTFPPNSRKEEKATTSPFGYWTECLDLWMFKSMLLAAHVNDPPAFGNRRRVRKVFAADVDKIHQN